MNVYELFTCGHYLSDYPKDQTFEAIVDMLVEDSDDIVVHEPFYGYEHADIADEMEFMCEELMRLFIPREV
jgi:hypothetical protein